MTNTNQDRALLYTRDSGGKAETTPGQYVARAQHRAAELKLEFDGSPEKIQDLMRTGNPVSSDIYLDWEVPGDHLSRPALDALLRRVETDKSIKRIFIPARDRLARPDDPTEAMRIETSLRKNGITLEFLNGPILEPLRKGQRLDVGEALTAYVSYDAAGRFLPELAKKIIESQIARAQKGFSTGGRPPFGFRRWLVRESDREPVRQLEEGETVRQAGHRVVWLPGPREELELVLRILEMLKTKPAARVAAELTAEGIPAPDHARSRKDGGVRHRVSGVWHATTVTNIARNPLLGAIVTYGRRSMGKNLRFDGIGSREILDDEILPNRNSRTIQNAKELQITSAASFEPLCPLEELEQLRTELDRRAGTQRGKPRSRDPDNNPLGGRVFDMGCRWLMYRTPYSGTFRYVCGLYQQSHGQRCSHNHIDGPAATRLVLSALSQLVASPERFAKLEARLRKLAERDQNGNREHDRIADAKQRLRSAESDLDRIRPNLARARTEDEYNMIAAELDAATRRKTDAAADLKKAESVAGRSDPASEVAAAIAYLQRLTSLVATQDDISVATEAIRLANGRLALKFSTIQKKKRKLNVVDGGVICLGSAALPFDAYSGPTARSKVKDNAIDQPADGRKRLNDNDLGEEGNSLGNGNRGERRCCVAELRIRKSVLPRGTNGQSALFPLRVLPRIQDQPT